MRKNTSSPVPMVRHRFRRWCRKGYAAFASLHRAVTIGRLAAHVSERFQAKNNALHGCGWQLVDGLCTPDEENEPEELAAATSLVAGNHFRHAAVGVAFLQPAAESCPVRFFPYLFPPCFSEKRKIPGLQPGGLPLFLWPGSFQADRFSSDHQRISYISNDNK